jgi:hypothetical protein
MDHEPIGVWVEAAALILIFGLDFIERIVSSKEHKRQYEATQKQLLHSEKQAKASMLSAKAVVNTERPWLVVTWRTDENVAGLFRFGCKNNGNTPATVVSVSARTCFVKNLGDLKTPPDYSSPGTLPDLNFLVHSDSFPIEQGLNATAYVGSHNKESLISDSREFLVYYGNVIYRDALYDESSPDALHETRWCFVYQPNANRKFARSGPVEYNRYT